MDEYQISVSLNGKFLFRTEWDDNKERVSANAVMLTATLLLANVKVLAREKAMTDVTSHMISK